MDLTNKDALKNIQEHFKYSDEEFKEFISNPRNQDIFSKVPDLLNKTIIIEVLEAKGCNSRHEKGDKIYFDGAGNLLTKLCPKKICIFALGQMDKLIYAAQELFYAGTDPNEMRFKRVSCIDIGLKCGGWGNVLMEFNMVDRESLE
ncbi:MAG: hypothetical protein ACXACU_00315 [Candidatus Hodarchaeales archaeon]|jgi:uncharacterized repeat protein (TIGR04076 family)